MSARNIALAVAPRHRQRFDSWNCVIQPSGPSHWSLVLVLSLGHYGAVLDLRKFLRFLAGVYELMTRSSSRIRPGQDGLWLHRSALGEGDYSVVGCRQRLSTVGKDCRIQR